MRLNFSGSDEDTIREGVRRIGEVVAEQVALYGTLTGAEQAPAARRPPAAPPESAEPPEPGEHETKGARVLPMRRRRAG
jgi:2-aminoadipate transaminase